MAKKAKAKGHAKVRLDHGKKPSQQDAAFMRMRETEEMYDKNMSLSVEQQQIADRLSGKKR